MHRILYIEDDYLNLRLVKKMLHPMGYETLEATTAAQGIQMAVREEPDVILMDFNLPDMNGYDATRYLKTQSGVSFIPVIILTADTTDRVRTMCLEAGCDAYLNKPISRTFLLRTIRQLYQPTHRVDF